MQDYSESFVVVDVETANHNLSSICQIGIASFRDGALHHSWESLVNPEDHFEPVNICIHGIQDLNVRSAPTWPHVYPEVSRLLEGYIVVSHTPFDRAAWHRACEKYGLAASEYQWLDSASVARRTWPIVSHSGYGLSNIAKHLSIKYDKEHDALADARCAGEILLRAMAETGWSASDWLRRTDDPIARALPSPTAGPITHSPIRPGNPKGHLHGEVIVFTGVLSLLRGEAEEAADAAGCEVDSGVTKRTTLLVVGDQDIRTKLAGHDKSAKRLKAEELIATGQRIRIIGETDFRHLCGLAVRQTKPNRTALGRDAEHNEKRGEAPMFCGKCGKPIEPSDSFCRSCGTSAAYGASPLQVNPAPSAAPLRTKSTHQMKLGAVIFACSLFGGCPGIFIGGDSPAGPVLVGIMFVGMIVGAVMYFAGS